MKITFLSSLTLQAAVMAAKDIKCKHKEVNAKFQTKNDEVIVNTRKPCRSTTQQPQRCPM